MRVFLDTNVLVAAFATRGLCADLVRHILAEHELLIGEVVLTELRRILVRKLKVPAATIDQIDTLLREQTVVPKPRQPRQPLRHPAMRDPADRWILASAVAAGADVLVTGEADLLTVAAEAPLPILDPRAFWTLVRGGGPPPR